MTSPVVSANTCDYKTTHFAQANQPDQHRDHLANQITELAAHIHAATFRLLELIREFDDCKGWGGAGLVSCAHWLNWKCGMGLGAAREKVRVAHALNKLPKISQTFREGRVSYSKVRAMTRVATAKNEDYLLMIANHGTAVHVERLVRNFRKVKRIEALKLENTRHAQRELSWVIDDDGYWVIRGRLTAEQGALVQSVLMQVMEQDFQEQQDVPAGTSSSQPPDETHGYPEPVALRRADALVRMAQAYTGKETCNGGDRYMVHIHTDMDTLKKDGSGGQAELEEGGMISAETARRLCCDAGIVHWLDKPGGEALNIGRKSRSIPPAIRRALSRRDGGCRFPGCSCRRFVDAHHIRHWADGGETSVENLVLMCRHHHRLVHEGGFGIRRSVGGEFEFSKPHGEIIPNGPDTRSRGNVLSLFHSHTHAGIHITPKTPQSQWLGEKMDDDLAVFGMLQLE